ncbi:MAG: 4'-phosphopantetheinyl transferase superfamily protein [Nitrospirae bacterium]|nr:4'-phosphopantetheinyl transferase superfamily protein [Nitrospirota bacterium]
MQKLTCEWHTPPEDLSLDRDEIHVWRCFLDQPAQQLEALAGTLTDDEAKKAGRFHFQSDRLRFITARGVLRIILGRYLGADPAAVRFIYGRNGKPSLAGETESRLCFNVSHSRDLVLFAFTYAGKIGVDVEFIDRHRKITHIVERFYSPEEISVFNSLPTDKQADAFFTFWTCKEAYLKADGSGLSFGLDKVEISLTPDKQAALAAIDGDTQRAASWSLQTLDASAGYAAALAINRHGLALKKWQWGISRP